MKAVNQCIGRAVRHKADYASILLLDSRYLKQHIKSQLPTWILKSHQDHNTFGPAIASIAKVIMLMVFKLFQPIKSIVLSFPGSLNDFFFFYFMVLHRPQPHHKSITIGDPSSLLLRDSSTVSSSRSLSTSCIHVLLGLPCSLCPPGLSLEPSSGAIRIGE